MSLSSSPPPRSETGTPRPCTIVSLPPSSSPESSPEPTMFLSLSSSPESSPERKLEDKERSPDGSCNRGPSFPRHEPASPSYLSTTPSSPPGSETGTPRPYTVVPLPRSSSPDSSPPPEPVPQTIFLSLSSSPESSPERKRKRENADENEEQSPDGSCNQGPLSPGTPFCQPRKESRRKVRYVSPNETSTSPYYRPTSPEYGPSTYE